MFTMFRMTTYSEISPGLVLPVIKRSQASAHSRTMSVAYLAQAWSAGIRAISYINPLLVLALARERKLVLWLSVWDLVNTEPLIRSPQYPRQMTFHVLDIVEFRRQWIVDINDDDLPVGLLFIEQGHHAKNFDLLDLAWFGYEFANFANVERVVVSFGFRFRMGLVWVFPGLVQRVSSCGRLASVWGTPNLRESTVVP